MKIAAKVKDKIENKEYLSALKQILKDMKDEFDGVAEKPVDVGTLALAVSAAVAIIVVGVITGMRGVTRLARCKSSRQQN